MTDKIGFSIIIITWHNQKMVQDLVDSIHKYSFYKDHEILVGHQEIIPPWDLPEVRNTDVNMGFAENVGLSAATNKVTKHAIKDYICLMDDDMIVLKDWDLHLLLALERFKNNWMSSTVIEPIAPHYNINKKLWDEGWRPEEKPYYHNISNTPLLIPKGFWNSIGGYDEDFPNSGAELGLAKRAYDVGERLFLQTPNSLVIHFQSQSFKKLPGLKQARKDRDINFKNKYGMSRKNFVQAIGKGQVYTDSPV